MKQRTRQRKVSIRIVMSALIIGAVFVVLIGAFHNGRIVLAQTLPEVRFDSTSTVSLDEDEDLTIDVELVSPDTLTMTHSVSYRTLAGSATGGSDYTNASGTLSFTDADRVETVSINIINDTVDENTEFFYVELYNPVNVTLGVPNRVTVNINDDDVSGTATPVFADGLEPNNNFNQASETTSGADALCDLTFYPPGDQDYFRWWGKAGITYIVKTDDLTPGIDTVLNVYNSNQNLIRSNDDVTPGDFSSEVRFTAGSEGYYYARVTNKTPADPVNETYCFEVDQTVEPTSTPPPGFPPEADVCEFNSTIQTACLFVDGETKAGLNFVPTLGSEQDTDIFKLWVKPGIFYTCETTIPAGSAADTNMIFLDSGGNGFAGNDDKDPDDPTDFGSRLSYLSTYTGWLFIEVGPVNVPPLEEADQHEYDLTCTSLAATPTPTATATFAAPPPGSGGTIPTAVPTQPVPTQFPTPTPIDLSQFFTPTPAPPPIVQFQPLPTATSAGGGQQDTVINVTVYYDSNNNFLPELTEGIMDTAVALYDNGTGQLIAFGQTNEAGVARFTPVNVTGAIRVVVPFLNYSQVVLGNSSDILIRVAPQPLPIGIP